MYKGMNMYISIFTFIATDNSNALREKFKYILILKYFYALIFKLYVHTFVCSHRN